MCPCLYISVNPLEGVTNSNPEPQASRPNGDGSPRMASGRPRRGSNIPSYLRDYELQV